MFSIQKKDNYIRGWFFTKALTMFLLDGNQKDPLFG